MKRLQQHRLLKFALVGGIGFIADALVFMLCAYLFYLPLLWARGIAFCCAASVTWFGNRRFTFRQGQAPWQTDNIKNLLSQWLTFMSCALISALPNFLVFQSIILGLGKQGWVPLFALTAGVLVGMLSNYVLSSRWVFRESSR